MGVLSNLEKLPNFKSLGIQKVMDSELNDIPNSELQLLIDSEYFNHPHITNRPTDGEYCQIEVLECQSDSWWYRELIGHRFFCQILYGGYGRGRFIKSFRGVKLNNNKMVVFRDFDPKDVLTYSHA